ncbi:MAG: hypothetical protein SGILL_010327 [Bacillariaceae sp.]
MTSAFKTSAPFLVFILASLFMALHVTTFMPWAGSSLDYYKDLYSFDAQNIHKRKAMALEESDGNEANDDASSDADDAMNDNDAGDDDGKASFLLWKNIGDREQGSNSQQFEDEDEYLRVMRRIRQLNDCSMSAECRNAHSFQQLPQPVLNTAYYSGQGMGRMLAMAAQTCLIAATTGRPCLVDQSSRDPHYTFRSFVESTLDTDVDAIVRLYDKNNTLTRPLLTEVTAREAQQAIALLPSVKDGTWPKSALEGHTFDHVVPLGDKEATGDPYLALAENPDKMGLSPNWGDAWFAKHAIKWPCLLNSKSVQEGERSCYSAFDPRLSALMQNYMWRPTALSYGLHKMHKELVLGGGKNGTDSNSEVENEEYGAIHLRFVLWKSVDPKDENQLRAKAQKLHNCLQHWQEEEPSIKKWWLVADMMEPGAKLVDFINEQASNSSSTVQVFMENGWPEKMKLKTKQAKPKNASERVQQEKEEAAHGVLQRIVSHRVGGALSHSLSKDSTGPMGHEHLASSMMDWMVLYESKIAIITAGAFGETGANGNGKFFHRAASQQEKESCEQLLVHRH